MIFACFVFASALAQQSGAPVELKISHLRASRALEIIRRGDLSSLHGAKIEADDAAGSLSITGNADSVKEVRDIAKLIDVPRKTVAIKVTVDSEMDKETYQVSTKIYDMQMWKTSDSDTGVTVAIKPRINDDGSTTLFLVYGLEGANSVSATVRMKSRESKSFTLGAKVSKEYHQQPDGTFKGKAISQPQPKITIQVGS